MSASLQEHNAYAQLPNIIVGLVNQHAQFEPGQQSIVDGQIKQVLTPQILRGTVNTNLNTLLSYVNGTAQGMVFYVPFSKLNLPNTNLPTNDYIDVDSQLQSQSNLANLHNIGGYAMFSTFGLIVVLLVLLLLHFFLCEKNKFLWTGVLLFCTSVVTLILSFVGKAAIQQFAPSMVHGSNQPVQQVIGILLSSVGFDITTSWIYVALGVAVIGIIFIFIQVLVDKYTPVRIKVHEPTLAQPSHY